jgi:hypothetical protein
MLAVLAACQTAGEQSKAPSASPAPLVQARDRLIADVRTCTDRHGYAPENLGGVGEHELAPGELQWRQCSYDAARRYVAQNPALRGLYEQLIAEDIQMTSMIQQRAMTRTERRARNEQLLAQIRSAEQAQVQQAAAEQQRQTEEVRNVVDGLRGLGH